MGGFLRHTTSNLFNLEEEAMTPLEDKKDSLSQDIEQMERILEKFITNDKGEWINDNQFGPVFHRDYSEATSALTQLFNKRLIEERQWLVDTLDSPHHSITGLPTGHPFSYYVDDRFVKIARDRIAQLKEAMGVPNWPVPTKAELRAKAQKTIEEAQQ